MSSGFEPVPFVAASAEEAVAQIRARLGPDAVVLHVRPLKAPGLARLWQKPMIEVVACRPQPPPPAPPAAPDLSGALAGLRQELDEIRQQVDVNNSGWRSAQLLQKTGLLPLHAKHILDTAQAERGERPPASLHAEIALVRGVLEKSWREAPACLPQSVHILIGPAGSGKTTALCKWLAQTSLVEGRLARVWRLDGITANTAESLSVYCEILNVPHERVWQDSWGAIAEDIAFVDLPGVDWRDPAAVEELGALTRRFGQAHLHLVLNGAYDISVLLAQRRAFSSLPVEDLIITHLDEEPHWGKLWNLVLDGGHGLRHLSSGHNIPGEFQEATAEKILRRQFPR